MRLDKYFKIGLLLIGLAFLVVYYFNSQNGRFQGLAADAQTWGYQLLDTRTGTVYHQKGDDRLYSENRVKGEVGFYFDGRYHYTTPTVK
jgi:hypothetical protein